MGMEMLLTRLMVGIKCKFYNKLSLDDVVSADEIATAGL